MVGLRSQYISTVSDCARINMTAVGKWSLAGFACGLFWVVLSFVFFTAPQSLLVDVVKVVAVLSCPPFLVSFFGAPVLNAILYGLVSWMILRLFRHERTGRQ